MELDKTRAFDLEALEKLKSKYNIVLDAADIITCEIRNNLETITGLYNATPSNVKVTALSSERPTINSPSYVDKADRFALLIDKLVSEIPRYDTSAAVNLIALKELTMQLTALIGEYNTLIQDGFINGSTRDFNDSLKTIHNNYKDTLKLLATTTDFVREASKGLAVASTVYSIDPVNMSTGNFSCEKRDIVIEGACPIELIRTYNAIDNYSGVMGYNWVHNFEMHLSFYADNSVKLQLSDGRSYIYEWDALKNTFVCALCPDIVLRKSADQYEALDEGARYYFSETGHLVKIIDDMGNHYYLEYRNDKILRVRSISGLLNFVYNNDGLLVEVNDGSLQKVEYQYFRELLASSTKNGFVDTMYRYNNSKDKLTAITNVLEAVIVENIYDDKLRITRQNFPDGGSMLYNYDEKTQQVVLTERNGSKTIYKHDDQFHINRIVYENGEERFQYDGFGRKTRHVDKNNNITSYTYDESGNLTKVCNALRHNMEMGYNVENQPVNIVWPNGAKFELKYDDKGNLTELVNPLSHAYALVYDNRHRVTQLTAPDGSMANFGYDERNNLTSYTTPDGGTTAYWYDSANRVTKTKDANENISTFTYTLDGHIKEIVNSLGQSRKFTYTLNGLVEKIQDFDETEQSFQYNKLGKCCKTIHQDGTVTTYEYDAMWNLAQVTEANGGETRFIYNSLNQLEAIQDANKHKTWFKYEKVGNMTECRTAKGNITRYEYDPLNRIKTVTQPDGSQVSFMFNEIGKLIKKTNPLGHETSYTYDLLGQLTCETDHLRNSIRYTYTSLGNLESLTDPENNVTRYSYYPGGRLKSIVFPQGETQLHEYDLAGNLIQKTENDKRITRFVYDALDRLVETIDSLDNHEYFQYDALGRMIEYCDSNGNKTQYQYSPRGHLVGVIDPLGNKASYDYDVVGNLSSITLSEVLPKSYKEAAASKASTSFKRIQYEYDLAGNTVKGISADNSVTSYMYDEENHIVGKTDPDGNHTQINYSYWGSVTDLTYADGRTVEIKYDSLRRLTEITDWLGTVSMDYGAQNMLQDVLFPNGKKVEYAWDALGRKKQMRYPDGTNAQFNYDKSGHLIKADINGALTQFQYDDFGNLLQKDSPGAVTTCCQYDDIGRITEFVCANKIETLERHSYEYDNCGNVLQAAKERQGAPGDTGVFTYKYDSLQRLTSIGQDGQLVRSYEYDGFGNRIGQMSRGVSTEYQYNALQQLVTQKSPDKEINYQYDNRGNITKEIVNGVLNKELFFDAANQLAKVKTNNAGETLYEYSGTMQRMGYTHSVPNQPIQKVQYILDFTASFNNILQRDSNGTAESYVYNNHLMATKSTQYITDSLGSPLRAINGNGDTVQVMSYSEFGVPTGEACSSFGFTGYENDPGEMLYAKARYYNPDTGRFISPDPIMGVLLFPEVFNSYLYATNKPTRYTDKNGLFLNILVGALVGTVVNVAATVAVSVITGQGLPSGEELIGAAIGGAVGGAVMGALGPAAFTPLGSGIVAGVTSGVSTLTTNIAENITGKENHSAGDMLVSTAVSAGVGFGAGWLFGATADKIASAVGHQVGIQGINAGRNSFGAVFKTAMTKLFNGTANHISMKVIGKGIVYMFVDGFAGSLFEEGADQVADVLKAHIEALQKATTPDGKYTALFGESVNPKWICVQ